MMRLRLSGVISEQGLISEHSSGCDPKTKTENITKQGLKKIKGQSHSQKEAYLKLNLDKQCVYTHSLIWQAKS